MVYYIVSITNDSKIPVTLVIDHTIKLSKEELSKEELNKGLNNKEINNKEIKKGFNKELDPIFNLIQRLKKLILDKKLNIILCKSFQKFATFGTGKIKAGNITMIGDLFVENREYIEKIAKTNFEESSEDLQLIIHNLKYNGDIEMEFIEQTTKNSIIAQKALKGLDIVANGSFLYVSRDYVKSIRKILHHYTSFGSLLSTYSNPLGMLRISIGLEPKTILEQKFLKLIELLKKEKKAEVGEIGKNEEIEEGQGGERKNFD